MGGEQLVKKTGLSGLGNLSNLLSNSAPRDGRPLQLNVGDVRPDPENIRNKGDERDKKEREAFIQDELGPDVKERGVKQPISVRTDPENPGGYIINAGEGRYLATLWAGLPTVPAFIDEDFTDFDNAKENTKRLGLSGRQMARFIQKKQTEGLTKKEIAQRLGVSPATINQLSNLLKMPACIEAIYDAGRCRDLTTIAELMTIYKAFPGELEAWLEGQDGEVLRSAVKTLRVELEEPKQVKEEPYKMTEERGAAGSEVQDPNRSSEGGDVKSGQDESSADRDPNTIDLLDGKTDVEVSQGKEPKTPPNVEPEKFKRAIVQVTYDGRPARLILDKRPPAHGWGWVKYDDDGHEFEADLKEVELVALVEA